MHRKKEAVSNSQQERAMKKPVSVLYVKVIRAANLKKMDFLRKSDLCVKMKLTGDRLQSRKTTVT